MGWPKAETSALPEPPVSVVRPPVLCAGCPHRASFYAVKRAMKGQKSVFCGDIGCYTLGNAMPLWELPRAQTLIASKCRAAKCPFMVSTQMLHSMHHAAVPTRAEVADVYQAARSGADYLLLTGETAVGEYPVEAMTYFAKIAANGWADAE